MNLFKRNRKDHWEGVYRKLSPQEVGWYQASLQLINNTTVGAAGRIIDVGAGTSRLCRHLLDQGYRNLTVLDISPTSIEKAKSQIGEPSGNIMPIHQAGMRSHNCS